MGITILLIFVAGLLIGGVRVIDSSFIESVQQRQEQERSEAERGGQRGTTSARPDRADAAEAVVHRAGADRAGRDRLERRGGAVGRGGRRAVLARGCTRSACCTRPSRGC